MNTEQIVFGPFRFDPVALQLWRKEQVVAVQPKPLVVLRALATRPGQVVTKKELLKEVWAGTYVTQAVLKVAIRALREALGESAEASNYVETVGREGYRFLGRLQPPRLSESPSTAVPPRELERKLVAILSADVQGYSRLMGEDELATIRTLTAYREAMTALITQHRGRVVDAPGDNLLAEFASAVDAVEAAVAIQRELTMRNGALPLHRQMHYRIGINVGDVVVEGERIYGDGVNLAARLEALAEGGGICLSRSVYEQVRNKVALAYEYVGERRVKNIAEPVAVYRVLISSPPSSSPVASCQFPVQSQHSEPLPIPRSPTPSFVGRDVELAHLHNLLDKALCGEPQFVFVTGEPGIGKTTVVDAFRAQVQATGASSLGYGQCVEQYGPGEPYLPVLEAMGRLCREEGGQQVVTLLRKYAPTWLVQLPGVIEENELQTLRLQVQGATQQRMLREIAEAIEVGTVRRPLVLLLEDLHWSDSATIELLAYLAKRRQGARLLVVGTYRPIDAVMQAHPIKTIKQELQAHGLCEEMRLELPKKKEIEAYVAGRFPDSEVATILAQEVHRRTEGNPLFMVNVVEHFLNQGLVVHEHGRWVLTGEVEELRVPESLRQLIAQQVERLSEEQRQVLEGASVVGAEFTVAAVAAVVKQEMDEVETICEEVAGQGHFVEERGIGEWPDGTISGRYGFRHALYQNVLSERIAEARRIRLHRLIGERLETGYGERAGETAAELAVHFERGHDYRRAVQYCEQAGKNAIQRSANVEAISHLTKGLELLKTLPDASGHAQQELTLQLALSNSLMATKGYAAPEVEEVYTRALELCQQMGEPPQLFPVLVGLWRLYLTRAEHKTARELGEQCLSLAQRGHNPVRLLGAHQSLGITLFRLGGFAQARVHLEQALTLYDPQKHRSHVFRGGQDPAVACLSHLAWVLWSLGYPDQALRRSHEALALAQELSHPLSLAQALVSILRIHQHYREGQAAQERAEALMTLSTDQGFAYTLAWGTIMRGWAVAEQGQGEEGIAQMRQGITAYRATGAGVHQPCWLALLAEAYGQIGQTEGGLSALAEALAAVDKTEEREYEAELYRLRGELTLAQSRVQSLESGVQENQKSKGKGQKAKVPNPKSQILDPELEAEAYFLKAIEIARQQQAKSLELRATVSLACLWQQQGKAKLAHEMLADIYNWFTEGFDTKDLQEAKALIEELSH
jgi:predicted ATPase/class 3 adenylate cyclase